MEHHSSAAILQDDRSKTYSYEELLSLIRSKKIRSVLPESEQTEVIRILKNASFCNSSDNSGNTFLHVVAASYSDNDITKCVIDSGSPVDVQNNFGKTPLIVAIENNCIKTVATLLDANADLFISDNSGKNALRCFSEYKWSHLVPKILKMVESQCLGDNEVIANRLYDADWPLSYVVLLKNIQVTKMMLERGSEVDARQNEERTALHESARLRDVEHVKLLLNYNADPNALDRDNQPPLFYVYGDKDDVAGEICHGKRLEILKVLLDRGASITIGSGDTSSWYGVRAALRYGNKEVIDILLQTNIDVNWKDKENNTAVHILASNKNPGIFKALTRYTFDVDPRNVSLETPLFIAASCSNLSMIQFLLGKGADANAANIKKLSPICQFFDRCDDGLRRSMCIQLLLEHGADSSTVFDKVPQWKIESSGLCKNLLAQVALKKASGESIAKRIRKKINSHTPFRDYYEFCLQQLTVKLNESVTLLELLTASDIKFERYLRNPQFAEFVKSFYVKWQIKLGYFSRILQKRYCQVMRLIKLKKEAACHFCQIVETDGLEIPVEITDKILSYLDEEDLKNLVQI